MLVDTNAAASFIVDAWLPCICNTTSTEYDKSGNATLQVNLSNLK